MDVVVVGGWAPSLVRFRGPLLATLVTRGHRVFAMAADSDPATVAELRGMGVVYEDVTLARAGTNPLADLRTIDALRRRLVALRPDVLFSYTIKPVIYGHIAARLAGVPRRYAMITGLGYAFAGQASLRRRVLRHGASAAYRLALTGADGVFLQNDDDAADLRRMRALPPELPVTIVRGSGVDLGHYAPAPLPPPPLRFTYLGRLVREKGICEFVEMARRVRAVRPDVSFSVAGWLDQNPATVTPDVLDGWIREGVIEYEGHLDNVRPLLARSHVLVLPSYREGTPRSVLEAMSMGRPVIVTDVPGCRATIVDGEQGYIVPAQDAAALAAAALRLVDHPELVDALGRAARARVSALYDANTVATAMAERMGL